MSVLVVGHCRRGRGGDVNDLARKEAGSRDLAPRLPVPGTAATTWSQSMPRRRTPESPRPLCNMHSALTSQKRKRRIDANARELGSCGGARSKKTSATTPRPGHGSSGPFGITQAFAFIPHPPANATQTTRTLFLVFFHSRSILGLDTKPWGLLE